MKPERKRDHALLAWDVTSEHFPGSLKSCNGAKAVISGAFRGGEINQLISLSFTHVFSGQAEQLHLGFHEVGADLVVYLWLGPNYRKNQALWLGGQAWEKHLKQLLGERAAEVRLMDPAFWLQRQGRMVRHIQVSCN